MIFQKFKVPFSDFSITSKCFKEVFGEKKLLDNDLKRICDNVNDFNLIPRKFRSV